MHLGPLSLSLLFPEVLFFMMLTQKLGFVITLVIPSSVFNSRHVYCHTSLNKYKINLVLAFLAFAGKVNRLLSHHQELNW